MSDIFLLADIQPVCGNGRQCCVQATTRLEQRREGKKEEKEAGSKEKVGPITCQSKLLSQSTALLAQITRVFWNNLVFKGCLRCPTGSHHHHSESI